MKIKLPTYVNNAISLLVDAGFEAFAVGGCVRDSLLGTVPKDWDITTSALPNEVREVFLDFKVIETGIKYGTVTVLIEKQPVEITTYRIDGEYYDSRHPSAVTFTRSLKEDLARRDFTINALAYSDETGVIDEFDGIGDLERKLIRSVGNPDKRFQEDALRIFRALRFSATLDFCIESETEKSIKRNAELLNNVAAERITVELLKFICGVGERVTKILIEYRDIFGIIIPELKPSFDFEQNNKHHIYDVYDHTAYSVGLSEPDVEVRLALLLHDIGKPSTYFTDDNGVGHFYGHAKDSAVLAAKALKRLRLSNEMYDNVLALVKYHDYPITEEKKIIRRRLNKFGPDLLRKLMKVKRGDSLAHNPKYARPLEELHAVEKAVEEILNDESECFTLKDLDITGTDLMEAGFKSGPKLGRILKNLLREVMDGELKNEKTELLRRAKEYETRRN
ncbi:MAG: HD domain-containing protein [Ruminococcaceae bacterium]|nr:HD domain-containing protein [Oscillospiraceae bacterium]